MKYDERDEDKMRGVIENLLGINFIVVVFRKCAHVMEYIWKRSQLENTIHRNLSLAESLHTVPWK